MACRAFGSALAGMLMVMLAWPVLAKDIDPPPEGGACDIVSQQFIRENGGIGVRVRVDAWVESDGLYFNLRAEDRRKLVPQNLAFGGLPAVVPENANLNEALRTVYGVDSAIGHLADMANRYGGWAVVVPYQGIYAAQVVVQVGEAGEETCVFAYIVPEYLGAMDVSARLMK
jgi:hypothetical protein